MLLVDARKGLLSQTRRHAIVASLLGIRHFVLAANKMDLVGFDQAVFDRIVMAFAAFTAELGFRQVKAISISATMFRRAAPARLGIPGRIFSTTSRASMSKTTAPENYSACRCNG